MTSARDYYDQFRILLATEKQRDELQTLFDAHKAELHSRPGPNWDCDKWLSDHRRLERELKLAKHMASIRDDVWSSLSAPARPRRTVLVDGIRTKLEYA